MRKMTKSSEGQGDFDLWIEVTISDTDGVISVKTLKKTHKKGLKAVIKTDYIFVE